MLFLEKIKRKLLPATMSMMLLSSLVVNAQGSIFIKTENSVIEVKDGSVVVKSPDNIVNKNIFDLHIKNGDTIISGDSTGGNSSSDNVDTVISRGVVTPVEGLNVRTGPSTSYSLLGTLKCKEVIEIYETSNGWHKIKYGAGFGYVSALYVALVGEGDSIDTPPSVPTRIKKIVIDPGHGGTDPGAIGPTGLKEKDVVLDISLKLRDILTKKGYTVVMTRSTDVYLSLAERTAISNSSGADFYLSVHTNSFSNPSSNGTETFSYQSTGFAADVARKIQSALINAHGLTNRGFKTNNFYVLKYNNVPAALAEIAFISNPYEESLLSTNAFRQKSAEAMAKAIESFN